MVNSLLPKDDEILQNGGVVKICSHRTKLLPLTHCRLFHYYMLDDTLCQFRDVKSILLLKILLVNSADPDQMPHHVASDLGLHCLPMALLWVSRLKWVMC